MFLMIINNIFLSIKDGQKDKCGLEIDLLQNNCLISENFDVAVIKIICLK